MIVEHDLNGKDTVKSSQDFLPSYYAYLGFIGPSLALAVTPRVSDGDVTAVEYEVKESPRPRNIFFLRTPIPHGVEHNAALSPKGDRLAWRFGSTSGPFGLRMPATAPAFLRSRPKEFSLWISGTKGEGMRTLGYIDARNDALEILRWTPDGKRLSFYHEGAIWMVPAD